MYFNTVKNFKPTLFFKASASCSKILNGKKYIFNTVNSAHTLFFKARESCSKILNVKLCSIQRKFSGQTLCFRASANCSKILNGKKYIQYSGQFHGKLFSRARWKNFNTVYSASKDDYRKVSCLGEHNTQETSPPWVNKQGTVTTEFAGNGTSRVLYSIKNVTAELKL